MPREKIDEKEDFKHVIYNCPTTKKALENTLSKFEINGKDTLKIKELWKIIYDEKGVRQYNDETILKTITSLFLATYLKMRYTVQNETEIKMNNITKDIIEHLRDLAKNNPKSHISMLLSQNGRLILLLESAFSPHHNPP